VIGGIGVVATVIIIGIVVGRSGSGSESSGPTKKQPSDTDSSKADYLVIPKNPKQRPAGWNDNPDPKDLTLGAAIKLGFALAQMKTRDARFVELQLHPLAKTGKVDLSRAKPGAPATKVVFESESLRAAGEKCQITITLEVAKDGDMMQGIELDSAACKRPAVPIPRCELKHLVETTKIAGKSQADETPLTARYANIDGEPMWTLEWQLRVIDEPTQMDSTYLDALCRE
jgi:hypothetical protein